MALVFRRFFGLVFSSSSAALDEQKNKAKFRRKHTNLSTLWRVRSRMFFSLSFFFLCSVFCVKFPGRPLAPDYLKKRPCSTTLKKSRKFCILKNGLNVFLVPAVKNRIFELCVPWCKPRVFGTVVFEDDAETFFAFFVLNSNAWRFLDPVFFLFLNSIFPFLSNNWIQKRLKRKKLINRRRILKSSPPIIFHASVPYVSCSACSSCLSCGCFPFA